MDWLLWTDIETTGLDLDNCKLIQIACVLTNTTLDIEYILGEITIKCDDKYLESMDDWCKNTHCKSGLTEKVRLSNISIEDAEKQIIIWLNAYISIKDTVNLAGNSIHFDKSFLVKYMPNLISRLNYRVIDVSSFSILCKSYNNIIYKNKPIKQNNHTALSDILESIGELKYYQKKFLNTTP